jgi:acetyl esterase/lipase
MTVDMPPRILARLKRVLIAGATLLLSCCSPFAAVNLLVPAQGYTVHAGLAYGADARQKLDVYVPDGLKAPAPVILFFYGGSWESGNRADYKAFGQAFASKGIVTVVADYRLYPQVKYPAFVQDGAAALVFVHAQIARYGGDPRRIFVAGHSAGAYNAVMLAADPSYLKAAGGDLSLIHGVIGISGPYDFLPLTASDLIDMFGGANNRDAMPINHVDGPRPPALLVTGDADSTVGPGNTLRMAARLKAHGTPVTEIHYPGVGHIGIILSLVPGFRGKTSLRQDMLDFIQHH